MRNIAITGLLSVASFAIGLGFQVSGYENIYLAYGLWTFSVILAVVTLCLWLIPKLRHKRKEEYTEIHEIEVPEDIQEKIVGKPKVEGRTFIIPTKTIKRKIHKGE